MKHFLFSLLVFCPIIASAQPRVFAHRLGGRQESDENTLSALLSASSQGMTGFETVLLAAITPNPVSEETVNIALALGVARLNATMDGSSRASIAFAHTKGLQVTVWPGSKPEDSVLGYWLGADALCSDCPLAAKQYMAEHLPWVPFVF